MALADWLAAAACTPVAMESTVESTGVFWKPIDQLLEDRFALVVVNDAIKTATSSRADLTAQLAGRGLSKRKYRRSTQHTARTWRTRADPIASIWEEVRQRLELAPERTAKSIFFELQREYPGRYPDGQLRTLQRRVKEWRAHAILQFDHRWLEDELLPTHVFPAALHAQSADTSLHSASAG